MFNVNNKDSMQYGGWNVTDFDDQPKDHTFQVIARPNNDTYYITGIIDVRKDAVILDMPAFDSNYVSLMITGYDHYVNIPMSTRLGDFQKAEKMLVYSERTGGYKEGEKIEGVDRYFEVTGDFISAVFRVMPHINDPERYHRITGQMNDFKMYTLSAYQTGEPTPKEDVELPQVGKTDVDVYANNLLEVMQFIFNHTIFDPENELDQKLLALYEPLGVVPGQAFDTNKVVKLDSEKFRDIAQRITDEEMAKADKLAASTGLFQPKGEISLDLLLFQSVFGPIGQPAQEAVYPAVASADGESMNAQNDYVISMSKEEMPPANAFWSFTLYDTENGFFLPNERKKYNVSENTGMKLNEEGGIVFSVRAVLRNSEAISW
ncbi:DUF1214 domain-containing protein [Eudoraea adriatica]|uniref:DUF1214 domain-containing protein n=1 Tax=Eudoraea adriatica TaxID=446681 RepID=UPI0003603385|nr:DUF1214 domain-containing protein [Eudoraea adriatica]